MANRNPKVVFGNSRSHAGKKHGMPRGLNQQWSLADYQAQQEEIKRAADAAALKMREREQQPLQVTLRGLTIDDAALVIDSWCTSYARSPVTGPISPELFKIEQRARINRLLPKSKQIVAAFTEDPRMVYGWVCYRPLREDTDHPLIHYMAVKPEYQGRGIGKSLLDLVRQACGKTSLDPVFFTHWTVPCRRLERKWNIVYDPYLLEIL